MDIIVLNIHTRAHTVFMFKNYATKHYPWTVYFFYFYHCKNTMGVHAHTLILHCQLLGWTCKSFLLLTLKNYTISKFRLLIVDGYSAVRFFPTFTRVTITPSTLPRRVTPTSFSWVVLAMVSTAKLYARQKPWMRLEPERALVRMCDVTQYIAHRRFQFVYCLYYLYNRCRVRGIYAI